jgi:hypothetical protein
MVVVVAGGNGITPEATKTGGTAEATGVVHAVVRGACCASEDVFAGVELNDE